MTVRLFLFLGVVFTASETKERILDAALELFSQNGYSGTSMSDIASKLGVTKAALYKHFIGKQEILDSIVDRMCASDYDRAEEYEMPVTLPDGNSEEYKKTETENLREYSLAQFDHWTKEALPSNFRKYTDSEESACLTILWKKPRKWAQERLQ